jgi:hypothetical protein
MDELRDRAQCPAVGCHFRISSNVRPGSTRSSATAKVLSPETMIATR